MQRTSLKSVSLSIMRHTDLIASLSVHGGVRRTALARRDGWSEYQIRRLLQEGLLQQPRKGWISVPGADPDLVHAAQHGAILSCVTQAKRLGLWVPEFHEPHFASPHPHANIALDCGRLHWGKPLIPREPGALVDSLPNVLAAVAKCRPFEEALTIWESALQQGRIEKAQLRQFALQPAARKLLEECTPYSDSGLETLVRTRLRWLRVSIVPQAWVLGHRVDFLFKDWLVLQIDGGHHVGAQRTRDITHDAELVKHGYAVVRVGYDQVVHRWPETQHRIMGVLAGRR